MGARDAMERFGKRLAEAERKAGKLPDSRAIERTVRQDFNKIATSAKPGSTHPLAHSRGG